MFSFFCLFRNLKIRTWVYWDIYICIYTSVCVYICILPPEKCVKVVEVMLYFYFVFRILFLYLKMFRSHSNICVVPCLLVNYICKNINIAIKVFYIYNYSLLFLSEAYHVHTAYVYSFWKLVCFTGAFPDLFTVLHCPMYRQALLT